jgi:cold shock CspA family protein
MPGGALAVGRDPALHGAHEDPYVALRDAFRAARRALMDWARVHRHKVKRHEGPEVGRVKRLFGDYGFLETRDGREIYFHANSVRDAFDRLARGDTVQFVEEAGDRGPQASVVESRHAAKRSIRSRQVVPVRRGARARPRAS